MNEKKYWLNWDKTSSTHTNGLLQDVIEGGISTFGVPAVYIPRDPEDPDTDIDYIWGELKKKNYTKGYGIKVLMNDSLGFDQGGYNFSKFGFLDITGEHTFYISIREFFQRMTGYDNVTETKIINGAAPTGYSEEFMLEYKPMIGDLIWIPFINKLHSITMLDDKEQILYQKYSVWKMIGKVWTADHRSSVDITGSEGHGLVPGALDIAPAVAATKDIQNTERITEASIDPTQTGNEKPDSPIKPLNKNIEISKSSVTNPNSIGDIFGNF